jgi:hypothetical protein
MDALGRALSSPEAMGLGAGIVAAIARLALYVGPPRPRMVALMDALATVALGLAAAEAAMWWTANPHAALAAGVVLGVLGWNEVRRWAWVARSKLGGGNAG